MLAGTVGLPCANYLVDQTSAAGVAQIQADLRNDRRPPGQSDGCYIEAKPNEGKRCFGVDYAVAAPFRGQGIAKAVLASSMEVFASLIAPDLSEPGYYLEAVIGVENEASNQLAKRLISQVPEAIFDSESSLHALYYITPVTIKQNEEDQ